MVGFEFGDEGSVGSSRVKGFTFVLLRKGRERKGREGRWG